MRRALVFSGGGSRGSYEVGAWQALSELCIRFQMCFGTSIGAINAAAVLQGDIESAVHLWDNMTSDRIISTNSEQAFQIERMFNRKRDLLPFLLEHARQLRVDIAPLEALLREHLDERRVRASGMDFGLIALRFPSLSPAHRTLATIPEGRLIDWIIASASCFPVFPTRQIDGDRYIDGGYYDNLPIDMAIRAGADEVVAVDIHPMHTHPEYQRMPFLTTIMPRRSLGNFLDFNADVLKRNRLIGYYDAMKKFGRFDGLFYTFTRLNDLRATTAGRRFMTEVARFDAIAVTRVTIGSKMVQAPVISAIESDLPEASLTYKQVYIRGLELAAAKLGFNEAAIYDADELTGRILSYISAAEDAPELRSVQDVEALMKLSDRQIIASMLRCLRDNGRFPEMWIGDLAELPGHAAAALYLKCACG